MSNQEFAEQILFGDTMADKLATAPMFSDARWQLAPATPDAPGRPKHLRFRDESEKPPAPPALRDLERDDRRGELLHFFANHELMATELMALALLRFQDAPTEFRRAIWNTLQDEQRHLRFYLDRMEALGVKFGDHPVNALFWRHLSSMECELDYITGLCLTYEQANLDFAYGYQQVFERLGDAQTASIMNQIVTDEIGHVRHGVRWIDTFSADQGGDLFSKHLRNLPKTLSMKAARGLEFNEELRTRAGLDEGYVNQLLNWRGRQRGPANVWTFNPRAEEALAHGAGALPRRDGSELLASELAPCLWPLGSVRDIVRVNTAPPAQFVANLKRAGFNPPQFLTTTEIAAVREQRALALAPWAATDHASTDDWLQPSTKTPAFAFTREFDHAMQLAVCVGEDAALLGRPASTIEEVEELTAALPAQQLVLKANLSASGGERVFAPGGTPLSESTRNWVGKALEIHGAILVEPWLDRVLDFSMQIEVGDRSKLLGRVFLSNDRRGRYLSHRIEKRPAGIPTDVQRILNDAATRKTLNSAWRTVAERLLALGHRGAAGIDAMIYRSQSGELQLRPIVEVNPRYTFGRIALELRNTHTSDEPALMTVLREADLRAARVNTMEELLQRLASEGQDVLALTPVGPTSKWAMVRMIGPVSPGTLAAVIETRVTNDAFLVQQSSEAQ